MMCFACETMVWQCSTEDYMKSCFKPVLLITHTVGRICVWEDSSREEICCDFWTIFSIFKEI